MRGKKTVDLTPRSYLLADRLGVGEIYMIKRQRFAQVAFIYKDMDSELYFVRKDELKPFRRLFDTSTQAYVKLNCSVGYLQNILSKVAALPNSLDYYDIRVFGSDIAIELNGEDLKPYDYINVLNENDFTTELGLLIGENLALLLSGKKTHFRFCIKIDSSKVNKERVEMLKKLYQSLAQQGLSVKKEKEPVLGDVYKRGEYISICLGKASIKFKIDFEALKKARIAIQPVKAMNYYDNENGKILWFRFKMSDDVRIREPVLKLLDNEEASVGDFGVRVLLQSNLGGLKLKHESCVYIFYPFDILKYDIKNSVLGDYIGHFNLTDGLYNTTYGFKTYGCTEEVKKLRRNVRIMLVEAQS